MKPTAWALCLLWLGAPAFAEEAIPPASAGPGPAGAVPAPAKPVDTPEPAAPEPAAPKVAAAMVHVTGTDPEIAKAEAKALDDGQRQAFESLIRARDLERAEGILKKISPADRAQLVRTTTPTKEIRRAGHYEADVTYVFDGKKLDQLVAESRGLVPELNNDSLLVLAVTETPQGLLVWEQQNEWRKAMDVAALSQGGGKLVSPFGDPKDAITIDSGVIASGKTEPLADLARRYGTGNLVIVTCKRLPDTTPEKIEVRLTRPNQSPHEGDTQTYTAASQESEAQLLTRAANETAALLQKSSGSFGLFAQPDAMKLKTQMLRVQFANSREWAALRQQTQNLPGVEFIDISAVSANSAQLTLFYRGDPADVRGGLEGRGLQVSDSGSNWLARLH